MLEFGLDTFMPVTDDGHGQAVRGDQVVRDTIEEAVLAEAVGIDSFNIGEHYRPEFMDSANHVVLAAIAGQTQRIRLGTAVTVLSTQDPVRVYTDFATLDAVSNGRAQLIVGRGSATESFPLFGFDLADYEQLFEEKLDLLVRLLRDQPVSWSGSFRSPLTDQLVGPPVPTGHLPTWVGVGGSPNSVIRAARYRPAADARGHRRAARALRTVRRALQARARAARTAGAPGWAAFARLRGPDRRRGDRDPVALLPGAVRVGRARAWMASADIRAVPPRGRPRLDVRRLAGDRREPDRNGDPHLCR